MKNYKILFALFLGLVSFGSYAQDTNEDSHSLSLSIPEVALLDLEATNGTNVTLGATAPNEAGLGVSFNSTDSSIWLNYSSIVGSTTEPSRSVTVQITSGSFPGGMQLSLAVSPDAGNGEGTMGTARQTVIDGTVQNIINGIGSAYTGDGVNNGHNLTYTLGLAQRDTGYGELDFDTSTTLTVTYTLTDN